MYHVNHFKFAAENNHDRERVHNRRHGSPFHILSIESEKLREKNLRIALLVEPYYILFVFALHSLKQPFNHSLSLSLSHIDTIDIGRMYRPGI